LKIAGSVQILYDFFHGKSYSFMSTKMDWATFWALFSQTHLVTLIADRRGWGGGGWVEGDQIGRIFALWVPVYFGLLIEN
jgi:hypothetical protein